MKQSLRWFVAAMLGVVGGCSRPKAAPEPAGEVGSERVREPAVAGTFYPSEPGELRRKVEELLGQATLRNLRGLRALISPHAGYRYSGPIAASGFRQLTGLKFERVVIFAPSHHVAFRGVAIPEADAMRTPIGKLRLSPDAKTLGLHAPFLIDAAPHAKEHSLEVELPFLQVVLGGFEIVPLVFGTVDEADVARQVAALADARTLFVASSDLSHYYPYEQAKALDEATVQAILRLDIEGIGRGQACGKSPVLALAHLARSLSWRPILLDQRNSGDTAGDRSRVVGYVSIAFTDE
jgi:MEMO1 family protein